MPFFRQEIEAEIPDEHSGNTQEIPKEARPKDRGHRSSEMSEVETMSCFPQEWKGIKRIDGMEVDNEYLSKINCLKKWNVQYTTRKNQSG